MSAQRAGTLAGLLMLLAAVPAMAQYNYYEPGYTPLHWQIEAGYDVTSGTTSTYLSNGWTLGGGLTWYPSVTVPAALRVDLSYSEFAATNALVNLGTAETQTQIDSGVGRVWGGDVDGEYDFHLGRYVMGYVLGGIGWYQRQIELDQTVVGGGVFCDPWWGFCGPSYFPVDAAVAQTTSGVHFAWNGGVGIEFPNAYGGTFFIDVRYLRIATSAQTTEFIPIRFGLRF